MTNLGSKSREIWYKYIISLLNNSVLRETKKKKFKLILTISLLVTMLDVVWSNTILPLKEWEWGRPPNEWEEADFCNSCWRWCWLLIHISWRSCSFWISFFVRPRILNPRYHERKRSLEIRTVISFIKFRKIKNL